MEVTLHGGPHDGRRVYIDSAVVESRRLLIHDEPGPEPILDFLDAKYSGPTAIRMPISVYQAKTWKDGPSFWLRWTYIGHQ